MVLSARRIPQRIRRNLPKVVGNPIDEKTSKLMREMLENVVEVGGGRQAKLEGYRIGGKTGTAQMYDDETHLRKKGAYLVSFMGFVPYDDPQLVIYTVINQPNVEDEAHSSYAQNITREILKEVLPYMNVYPDEEQTGINADLDITGNNPPIGNQTTGEPEQ